MNRVLRPKNLNLESLPATTRLRPPQATGETSHPRRAVVRPRPSVVNSKNTKCGGADKVQPQVLELQRFPRSKTFSPSELPRVRRSSRLQGARFRPQIGEDSSATGPRIARNSNRTHPARGLRGGALIPVRGTRTELPASARTQPSSRSFWTRNEHTSRESQRHGPASDDATRQAAP